MLATRVRKARKQGTCPLCHATISTGQQIGKTGHGWCHVQCIITAQRTRIDADDAKQDA